MWVKLAGCITQDIDENSSQITEGVYDIVKGWLMQREELFKQRAPGNTCLSAWAGRAG